MIPIAPLASVKRVIVEITRSKKTRNLCARVLQQDARGQVRGPNLLTGRRIRKIESAKSAAMFQLMRSADEISFHIDAEALKDTKLPYKRVTRRELAERVSS